MSLYLTVNLPPGQYFVGDPDVKMNTALNDRVKDANDGELPDNLEPHPIVVVNVKNGFYRGLEIKSGKIVICDSSFLNEIEVNEPGPLNYFEIENDIRGILEIHTQPNTIDIDLLTVYQQKSLGRHPIYTHVIGNLIFKER